MSTPPGYISVNQAARDLRITPGEVRNLIDTGQLRAVVLVAQASLDDLKAVAS